MEELARSNSARVLATGNAAVRIRLRALDSSRAVISASTRVRSSSSGAQRWVLAVTSSSGASRRIAASLSRRSPAVRSGASGGGAVLTAYHSLLSADRVVRQRSGRHRGQGEYQRLTGRSGVGSRAGGG